MIIVTGLPRSGTSLMMNILQVNGIEAFTDYMRKPDIHNPKGYFEVEGIGRKLQQDPHFLDGNEGCVKILSPFLEYLQGNHSIIFMERELTEVFRSMEKMSNQKLSEDDKRLFEKHLKQIRHLLRKKGFEVVYINYNKLVQSPDQELEKLKILIPSLDIELSKSVIDPSLYRNRLKNS